MCDNEQWEFVLIIVDFSRAKARRTSLKKNPLKNLGVMLRLNPHAKSTKRAELLTVERRKAAKEAVLAKKRGTK